MNTRRTKTIAPVLLATAIAVGLVVPAAAESPAELLEKGIYTEQTVGDLSAAIEIYTQVVENDETNRPHVAEAQFRLGVCYRKRGADTEARAAFEKLIREYPEQERLVAQAREQLTTIRPSLALGPVPWKDGESLEYQINLPTGKTIGTLFMTANSTVVDGVDSWQLELRKFVAPANHYGISRVLVDHHSQRPLSSEVRLGALGDADATYGPEGAEITGGPTPSHVEFDQEVYDNEQSMHLLRMLPFEPGYKVSLSFLPTWVATVIDVELEVTGKELCQVPAGEFECYAVVLDIGQEFWFSTGPERYMLRLKAGGVLIELAEIGQTKPGAPIAFGLQDFGFSGTLPDGWMSHEQRRAGRTNKAAMRLLDPEAETISSLEIDRCPQAECPSLKRSSERELAGATERFDSYKLREGSWIERTIEGRPAISFVGDYKLDGAPWVQYRLYTFTDDVRLEFIFRAPADRFEELRPAFDSIAESVEAE